MGLETNGAAGAPFGNGAVRGTEEQTPQPAWRRPVLWLTIVGWTALVAFVLEWLGLHNGGPSLWILHERNPDEPGFTQTVHELVGFTLRLQRIYPWVLFGPYLIWVAWFFPLERTRLHQNLPLNFVACLTFAWACHEVAFRSPRLSTPPGPPPLESTGLTPRPSPGPPMEPVGSSPPRSIDFESPRSPSLNAVVRSTILDLLAYGAITGLVHSVYFHRRLRERERRTLVLESHLARARLNTLKAQLQPHFLFNSLNAITTLLRRDPRLAEATLVSLSELLRLALSQSERQETSLREELEFVQRYLEIQQTRFGDKLRVEQDFPPATWECRVPTLVLQPLVENALRHGIEPADKPGTVRLTASRVGDKLVLTVEDDGLGLPTMSPDLVPKFPNSPANPGTGIGLSNLRDRLQTLYGDRQKLELSARPTGGVLVRVEIPWQSAEANDANPKSDA